MAHAVSAPGPVQDHLPIPFPVTPTKDRFRPGDPGSLSAGRQRRPPYLFQVREETKTTDSEKSLQREQSPESIAQLKAIRDREKNKSRPVPHKSPGRVGSRPPRGIITMVASTPGCRTRLYSADVLNIGRFQSRIRMTWKNWRTPPIAPIVSSASEKRISHNDLPFTLVDFPRAPATRSLSSYIEKFGWWKYLAVGEPPIRPTLLNLCRRRTPTAMASERSQTNWCHF